MQSFLFRAALICGLLVCGGAACAEPTLTDIDVALEVAQARQQPVFIDFSAIWCHSCHAMDDQVLNGADWDARLTRMVLVRSDADGENGDAWMKKLKIPSLPTYVVLNPDGSERGRLVGEIKRAQFYPALDRLLDGSDGVDKLKGEAAKGSVEAVTKVLEAYNEREDARAGMKWYASLPEATRKAVQNDTKAAAHLHAAEMYADKGALLDLLEAQRKAQMKAGKSPSAAPAPTPEQTRLSESCVQHAKQALAGELTTDERVGVTRTMVGWCSMFLSPAQKKALALAQLPAVQTLYEKEVPNGGSGLLREATHLLATLQKDVDDKGDAKTSGREDVKDDPAVKAIYQRAVAIGRKALDDGHGGLDVKRDRSMGMVLAEMMDYAGLKDERIVLDKAMAETYPDDFFCQLNYGSDLLKNGKAAEALPYLERASASASEGYKLSVAYQRAKALIALNRRPEAEKLFQDAMRREEKMFPDRAAMSKQYMKL